MKTIARFWFFHFYDFIRPADRVERHA